MAGKISDSVALALRYAVALIEKAEEDGALVAVESDIVRLSELLSESDDFRAFVHNPLVDSRRQVEAVSALAEKAGCHKLVRNFLCVLAANRRLSLLEEMITVFGEEMSRIRGEVRADVETAFELNGKQVAALKKDLSEAMGSDIRLNLRVREELVGGLRIIVGSRMIDNTVSHKLERLQRSLSEVTEQQMKEVS